MSRVALFKSCVNAIAESHAMDVFKVSSRGISTREAAQRGGYHVDIHKDNPRQAINRLSDEAAKVAKEIKDRILGRYNPDAFLSEFYGVATAETQKMATGMPNRLSTMKPPSASL